MSNAMRTGKRWLAGVAAGALGAGLLALASAPSAQAAVASIRLSEVGLSVVDPNANVNANFAINVSLRDSSGNAVVLDGETISAQVTSWPATTAGTYDDSAMITLFDDTSTNTAANYLQTVTPGQRANGSYQFTVNGAKTGTGNGNWNPVLSGTYNVRVTVTTTASGQTVVANLPVIVYASTVTAPPASVSWRNSTGATLVNAASAAAGTAANTPAYAKLLDTNGYALIAPLASVTAQMAVDDTTPAKTVGVTGGINAPTTPGLYTLTPNGGGNWVAGANAYNLTYATSPVTTASLPLTISSAAVTATSISMSTTPSVATTSSLSAPVYLVPAGTTSLTFSATTATVTSTAAWTTTTNAAGGEVTSTAGVAAISGGGYSVNVVLNAAAAANGRQMTFVTGGLTATVNFATPAPQLTADTPLVAKFGDAVTITGALVDQWERPFTGAAVVSVARTTPSVSGTLASANVAADGTFSLTVPASAGPTAAATYTYTVSGSFGGVNATPATVTVQYTATGTITSLSVVTSPVTVSGQVPAILTSAGGTVTRSNTTTVIVNPATADPTAIPGSPGAVTAMTFTSVPSTSITLKGSEGVNISTGAGAVPVAATSGSNTLVIASGDTVTVWSTKAGSNTVTATAGGQTATASFYAFVPAAAARNVAVTPAKVDVRPNAFVNLTAKVTDIFGNPVPGVSAAAGNIAVALAGGGTIPAAAAIPNTNAAGETSFSYTSPTATGAAQITVVGNATFGQFGTSITGVPAPVRTAAADITVTAAAEKSIVIVGERTTVSGKSGIMVDGVVKGIENGKTVKPFIRFPGQTTFTEGTARPVIQAGEFTWQRKTGKRVTVYVTSDDGATVSNRVTIQAS